MTLQKIKLPNGEWQFDDTDQLGPAGGFGEVFRGKGSDGDVAVKRLKLTATQAAHRELNISKRLLARDLLHVVPVLDAGQDAESDRYYIVMPVCEKSLQDEINANGSLEPDVSLEVIRSILSGLEEVGDITHRDLKPGNVLLHEGIWKIADFGISKFVEDSTSFETLRTALSPAYAAPEQWRGERPVAATDIYSLGCIIYALVTSNPPFSGDIDELRDQHLHKTPDPIGSFSRKVATFVTHMLRKTPSARPTLKRCLKVFSDIELETKDLPLARQALLDAADHVARTEAEAEAAREQEQTRLRERAELFDDASGALKSIREELFREIQSVSESAKIDSAGNLSFGSARLKFDDKADKMEKWRVDQTRFNWDIIAWATISITCSSSRKTYSWSATLLYADRQDGDGYRWYEIAFWVLSSSPSSDEPFALGGSDQNLILALGPAMHSWQIAYGPLPIDGENETDFVERWIGLTAKAARGSLQRPNRMPIDFNSVFR